ncbi:adhesion G protein-coupled receptor E5 [Spea bombifrons]|uniref:adhesion G protein-coupled receptor E5 n=1 Tax=Spea bombifrons TaxID=233779 RepID=UPI00234B3F99|nr:adhesion G protein-coupled receptor E5 [Spea bombifrons]
MCPEEKPGNNERYCGSNKVCPADDSCNDKTCRCLRGYIEGLPGLCDDVNECIHQPQDILCGSFTQCRNLVGSYYCECDKGYLTINNTTWFCPSVNTMENKCIVSCAAKVKTKQPCHDNPLQCFLKNLNNSALPACVEDEYSRRVRIGKFLDDLGSMLANRNFKSNDKRLKEVGDLLREVEVIIRNYTFMYRASITQHNSAHKIGLHVLGSMLSKKKLSLQSSQSSVELDWRTAATENTDLAMVGFLEYGNINSLLKDARIVGNDPKDPAPALVSPLLSIFVTRKDTKNLSDPLTFSLRHNIQGTDPNRTLCAFWSHGDVAWSTKGCLKVSSTENETVCNCNHMTSFAILMALQDIESWSLSLITKIGLSISIICLIMSIITFCLCRSIRGTRNTIHTHLCISLLLGACLFLFGIDATTNEVVCSVVAGLLHAAYLSSFCWMLLEGIELYFMLVNVFDIHYLKNKHLLLVGYGVPVLIVSISAASNPSGYGTEKYCWLSYTDNFIWAFIGPVAAIILVNSCFFILTVWKLAEKMSSINPDKGKLKRIRLLIITSVAQLCILGCCWVFGFLMFGSATYTFAYIFTILNVLQGLQIFLLHCLLHRKVREEYRNWISAVIHLKPPIYSEFSNSTNTQAQSKQTKSTNKESNL